MLWFKTKEVSSVLFETTVFFEARTVTAIAPVLKTLRALTNHSEVRCDCDLVSLLLKKSFDDFLESKHLVTGRKKLMRKLRKSRGSFRFNWSPYMKGLNLEQTHTSSNYTYFFKEIRQRHSVEQFHSFYTFDKPKFFWLLENTTS